MWVSTPCTGGSSRHAANVGKYVKRGDFEALVRLHQKRRIGIEILEAAARLLEATKDCEHGVAWEWPLNCSYWQLAVMASLRASLDLQLCRVDGCMVDMKSINRQDFGAPIKKPWRIDVNWPSFGVAINIRCSGQHEHGIVEGGKNTKATECYSEAFAAHIHSAFRSHCRINT